MARKKPKPETPKPEKPTMATCLLCKLKYNPATTIHQCPGNTD